MRQNIFMGQIWLMGPQFVTFTLPFGADLLEFIFLSNWTGIVELQSFQGWGWVAVDHCNLEAMIWRLVEEDKWACPCSSSRNWPGLGVLENLEPSPTSPSNWPPFSNLLIGGKGIWGPLLFPWSLLVVLFQRLKWKLLDLTNWVKGMSKGKPLLWTNCFKSEGYCSLCSRHTWVGAVTTPPFRFPYCNQSELSKVYIRLCHSCALNLSGASCNF